MSDMLVNLYQLPEEYSTIHFKTKNIAIKRALSPDSHLVQAFIRENFTEGWASETAIALNKVNPTCFVAIENQKVIGFASYDATAKGYFGPTGVEEAYRGTGIGAALLMKCLLAMREEGYGYAIIGSVGEHVQPFYTKVCQAVAIPNTDSNNVYQRMLYKN